MRLRPTISATLKDPEADRVRRSQDERIAQLQREVEKLRRDLDVCRAPYVLKQDITGASDVIDTGATRALVVVVYLGNYTGGTVTLTSNPCITDGQFGGQLLLLNQHGGSNTVVLPAGNGVRLDAGTNKNIGERDSILLWWDARRSDWLQLSTVQVT